ncbi:ABC transporter ATP-binding protein [Erysipelothrix sp. strain 2 (EsS2-7-Brazil)]|uniref:ABC transporter ATP-binding protein n=1 Tax=Erysipelothrix sp. strain 2 (EsS2-7-Brazil) TaxID=2500579 RepID=UPI00190B233F|nr:ABC transporter ATP-binding protein [Erysipelothrix sp. strain 2 (EsS2-7-Brazil)]MBK2404741.1 ABC transporter ATP-binding protein [Erysipelothrix sp. strain 2 (EsS2-7-Brazil)]
MKSYKKLWRFLKPYKVKLFGAVLCLLVAAVLTAAAPMIEGFVTTQLASDVKDISLNVAGAHIQFDVILRIISILFVIYVTNALSRLFLQYLISDAIQSAVYDMRMEVKKKMERLPVSYFDKHSAGDLMARMSTDIEALSGALQQSFAQVVMAVLGIIFAVILMISIDFTMALVGIAIIPLSILVARFIMKRSQVLFTRQQEVLGNMFSVVQEKFTGFNEIKLYNYQENATADFRKANEELCENGFKANFFSGLMTPSVSMITYIAIALSVYMGAIRIIEGAMAVGALQAFIRYIWQVNQPLSQITQMAPTIQASIAAMDRVFEYLEEPDDVYDIENPVMIDDYEGSVSFENVYFGYGEKPVIQDLSVDINPGEMVAIVGPTGAGKTTIINLLMRFYDVNEGSIKIDGIDIRDMKRDDLRSLFGMVLQDTWLFSGKIKENIAYGKPDATDEEIIDAAKRTNVHHFITTLPNGYDMVLNEESSNISNGEKQLITIARALLSDPKILILDEATSSVDTRLDAMIQEAMAELMKGRTSFVIAHRLSTIKNADKILVVKDGNIIEMGNHHELMAQGGFYADLYNSQFADDQE